MRVLHFVATYLPVPGGTTTRVFNMLASPENEHVVVVPWPRPAQVPDDVGPIRAEETQGHVHVHRVPLPPAVRWAGRVPFWRDHLQARAFVQRVQAEPVDVLHGHNPLFAALASLYFKRQRDVPMVYEAHGVMRDASYFPRPFGPIMPLNRMSWWLPGRVSGYFERPVVRAADRVIVQTESARRRLVELYGVRDKPIDVIRNGVDPQALDPVRWAARRDPVRRRHGWNDRIVCLYAGYLDAVNGMGFLIDVLPRLTGKMRSRLKIVLIGRGPEEQNVKHAAEEHGDVLEYPGLVRPEEVPEYYAACDVFMIPRPPFRPGETLVPLKLLEAMAMGKTLLVSNVAAMAEIVTDGRNGLVFEKGNRDDFLGKLARIAESDDQLECLGRRARQDVLERYNWDAARTQLQAIYDAVTRSARRSSEGPGRP